MDKSFQRNLMFFLGMISAIGGAFFYFKPGEDLKAQASIIDKHPDIEERLQTERKTVMSMVFARTATAEAKLDDLKSTLHDFRQESREMFKKLDDRIYELQRRSASLSEMEREGG